MSREWPADMPESRKRRILLESIERDEERLEEAQADLAAAVKKLKPVRERERTASRAVEALRERLREERAELRRLVTDDQPEGTPVP
jgi:septal ring factor EnvC (AmiA/AmiB activator)